MTTIDKIRDEIKKLQDIFVETAQGMETEDEATVYSMCAVEFGDELLSFLDTLEEPVSDDDKDMIESIEMWLHEIEPKWVEKEPAWLEELRTRLAEEPVSENLEEEIDRVIADYAFTKTINSGGFKTTVLDYAKIARHFYELGRNARKEDKK